MTMQALVWTGNHNVTVRDQPQPIPSDCVSGFVLPIGGGWLGR